MILDIKMYLPLENDIEDATLRDPPQTGPPDFSTVEAALEGLNSQNMLALNISITQQKMVVPR